MAYYRTEIVVPYGAKSKIGERNGCTHQYVGQCLRYEKNSELADRIRKDALQNFHGKKIQLKA